jgi:thioredoxin-related protein
MKPIVDGLEQELAGRLRVIRLNVQDPVGKALAGELGFRMTPTFIFFDAQGKEAWREVGRLDAARVRRETP